MVKPESAASGRKWETGDEYVMSLDGNHSTMVKFDENDRGGYEKVRYVLRDFTLHANSVVEARVRKSLGRYPHLSHVFRCVTLHLTPSKVRQYPRDQTNLHTSSKVRSQDVRHFSEDALTFMVACLQSLYFPEMYWRQHEIADPAIATCTWLSSHPKYLDWLSQRHGLLWIKGTPGAGKSMVMKEALETIEREQGQRLVLASFFFHGRGKLIQKSALGLFRSILHQIARQVPEILPDLTTIYTNRSEVAGTFGEQWTWHEGELRQFFKEHVADAGRTYRIRLYIDALDECGEEVAVNLVDFFEHFRALLSICFSCRHYPLIAVENSLQICVENENRGDITAFVNYSVKNHISDIENAGILGDEIVTKASGNFQWVTLVVPEVLKMFRKGRSLQSMQANIQRLPSALDEMYGQLLDSIDSEDVEQALRLLQWICFSFKPLSLEELRIVMVIDVSPPHTSTTQCKDAPEYTHTDQEMERRILDLSRGLAEVRKHKHRRIVQFVHQSVSDFLIAKGLKHLGNFPAADVVGCSHYRLSRSCIKYFAMEEFRHTRVRARPFLKYALGYCIPHAIEVEKAGLPQSDLLVLFNGDPYPTVESWIKLSLQLRVADDLRCLPRDSTLLHIASAHNLISVIRAAIQGAYDMDVQNSYMRTPLSYAAEGGHEVVVAELLDSNVNADSKDHDDQTPLSWAAGNGHEKVVRLLLGRIGVDVNSKMRNSGTPLSEAIWTRPLGMLKLRLRRDDTNVNSDNDSGTLHLGDALKHGDERVIKLLVAAGADVNIRLRRAFNSYTLLQHAILANNMTAVILLLDHGAEFKFRYEYGGTEPFDTVDIPDAMVQLFSERGILTQVMTTPRLRSSHLC